MHRITGALVAATAMLVPAAAQAQQMGAHEVGVDVAVAWVKPSGGDGSLEIMTPVDVRLGFASRSQLSLEPRFSMLLVSDGGTAYRIDPGLNVLYRMSGTATNRNTYLTFGGDIDFLKAGVSGSVFALNGGFGMRHPWGAGAFRTEIFARYAFEETRLGVPNTFSLGVRLGLSVWH